MAAFVFVSDASLEPTGANFPKTHFILKVRESGLLGRCIRRHEIRIHLHPSRRGVAQAEGAALPLAPGHFP